jgi:signal peptide peptidase SppA
MKSVPFIFELFGISCPTYATIADQIERAAMDDAVQGIALKIDSPGGQVTGVEIAAQAIASAAAKKPVSAYIDDLGASAAYWLASQASRISANANAEVGSIGVYSVAVDASKMAEDEGLKINVISSGAHKGVGVMGAPITDPQIAALQHTIDGLADNFVAAVSRGRQMPPEKVRASADGRTWLASEALDRGLVDSVETFESMLAGMKPGAQTEEGLHMAEASKTETTREEFLTAERARKTALVAAFPEDKEFAGEQFLAGATVAEAKAAYCDVLKAKMAAQAKEAAKANVAPRGAKPVPPPESDPSDVAPRSFMEAARDLANEKSIPMREAMSRVARANPELYAEHKKNEEARSARR